MTKLVQSALFTSTSTHIVQIILRARQNHLVDKFRADNTTLTFDLLNTVHEAWVGYIKIYVHKSLSDGQNLDEEKEELDWPKLSELIGNSEWKRECLKRDEKFEMYFTVAVRASSNVFSSSSRTCSIESCYSGDSKSSRTATIW